MTTTPSTRSTTFDAVPDAYKVKYTWLDGQLVDAPSALVPIMSYTMQYGLGVFEGIRAYEGARGPAVFRLREHMERLHASAELVRIEMPFSVDELCAAATETLGKNGLAAGYLRPVAFVDDGRRGLGAMNNRVRVAIVVWPWGAYLGDEGIRRGIRCQIASVTRMSPRSFLPKGKITGQYVNSIIAKRQALLSGYDEAILLDDIGNVAEATGENVFYVKGGVLHTPSTSSPILEGITRDSILRIAKHTGVETREANFSREALFTADEVFLCGTAAEVTPVREIDGHVIGAGSRGPLTEKLQATYFEAVNGRLAGFEQWLTGYSISV
jgi:branched-chain amino acid aminotransferase